MKDNQQNMPPVVVPARPAAPRQGGTDPFSRPAGEVTVEEWRILICSVAGRLRLSQGFSRTANLPATGVAVLLAQNDKSYALFIYARELGNPFTFSVGGDPRSATAQSGIEVSTGSFEQILLPKEKLYATSAVGGVLVVTEVTV